MRAAGIAGLALAAAVPFAPASPAAQSVADPIAWALAVQPAGATASPGATVTLALTATVDDGWHLYATKLEPGGPLATSITVPDGQVFSLAGDIVEPVPVSSFDPNFNRVLEYHEGKVVFTIPVKSAANAPLGTKPARVAINYQTCNDRMCLPARQVVTTADVEIRPRADQRPPVPPDRSAFDKALSIKDLAQQLDAILKYATDFPDSDTVYFAVARGMRNIGDADGASTARLATFVRAVEHAMDDAGAKHSARNYQRADVYYNMAYRLVNRGVLNDDALRMAGKSVPLLDKNEFMAKELATHNEREAYLATKTPGRTPDPFPRAESEERWTGIRANHLSTLGRALLASGRRAEAETTLRESYALTPVMETALALAQIAEKDGRLGEALDLAVAAELTGKMTTERAYLEMLYRKTHNGSVDGLTDLIDRTYRAHHVNPISAPRYVPTPARSTRTVLAELFTGAACIPCVSVDLSFERVLERYSRADVAFLVYHIHAPTSDPYSNFAVEDRNRYYGVNSAPTVLLDGDVAPVGEGGGPLATSVFPKIDAAIAARLETPTDATLSATARRSGSTITATAKAGGPSASGQTVRLQMALVEIESSYSGENGLHFQPMVVRASLGAKGHRGVLVAATKDQSVAWSVDLSALSAENLEYYDWYIGDLKKRANIDAAFRERRNEIPPSSRLAVVAFLQDDLTHAVLQSVFVPVK